MYKKYFSCLTCTILKYREIYHKDKIEERFLTHSNCNSFSHDGILMVFPAYKSLNDIVLHVHYGILDERAIN